MSQTESSPPDDRPTLGARGNWWGDNEGDADDQPDRDGGHPYQDPDAGPSYEEYVAHQILKKSDATMLDPVSLHEVPGEDVPEAWCLHDPEEVVALSEPTEYVPRQRDLEGTAVVEWAQERHRWRYSEEYGYESFGGPLEDRPAEEFLALVDEVLAWIQEIPDEKRSLPPGTRASIYGLAQSLKADGDYHDTQIMAAVVRAIEYPQLLDDRERLLPSD